MSPILALARHYVLWLLGDAYEFGLAIAAHRRRQQLGWTERVIAAFGGLHVFVESPRLSHHRHVYLPPPIKPIFLHLHFIPFFTRHFRHNRV